MIRSKFTAGDLKTSKILQGEAMMLLFLLIGLIAGAGLVILGQYLYHRMITPNLPSVEDLQEMITDTITELFENQDDQQYVEGTDND